MTGKLFSLFLFCCFYLCSPVVNACAQAEPTNSPQFCSSFKSVAKCHCKANLPEDMCDELDMRMLYDNMLEFYGTVQEACDFQRETSPQQCVDDWLCYRKGHDSKGAPCSGTGKACE